MFLEALQLLEACTANKGVAGGAVLHNSRIVVSQLDASTNMLVALTDPYRIKVGNIFLEKVPKNNLNKKKLGSGPEIQQINIEREN